MSAGRPSEYDPAYCERIIELGEGGASIAEMAYELGCCKNTLTAWANANEEFLNAFTRAKMASQVWWERKGRAGMEKSGSEFQGNIWSRNMAARFPDDWREVKGAEITGKNGAPIQTETKIDVSSLSDETLRELAKLPVE